MTEVWTRPWAFFSKSRRIAAADDPSLFQGHSGSLWFHSPTEARVEINGKRLAAEPVVGFSGANERRSLEILPIPSRRPPTYAMRVDQDRWRICWPDEFARPAAGVEPSNDVEAASYASFQRAENVWDRLSEFETALADPVTMWAELRRRWAQAGERDEPRMDLIVRHARRLAQTIDAIDRAPRRILRRTHRQVPIGRVQEMDRRTLTWLIRQPGDSLAERAGDTQRVLGVTREENIDTLENQVVRSYAQLAFSVARDYCERHRQKDKTRRYRDVLEYSRRCRRLARDLAARGVREAEAGVTPNFVLLENDRYHKVWDGWLELMKRRLVHDELWRWQGRSWEEFCALAIMVALQGVQGARLVAASPIVFLDEQHRGVWVEQDNPFGVFHLPEKDLVIEVQYRPARPGPWRADLAAPIWLRIGRTDDPGDFQKYIAIWPLWDIHGGLCAGEAVEVAGFIPMFQKQRLLSAILIRPTQRVGTVEHEQVDNVTAQTLGVHGAALIDGIEYLTQIIDDLAQRSVG